MSAGLGVSGFRGSGLEILGLQDLWLSLWAEAWGSGFNFGVQGGGAVVPH